MVRSYLVYQDARAIGDEMDGKPNKLNVSIALDKEDLHADVALRDLNRPDEAHALTPRKARHIAAMLVHSAKLVEQGAVVARDLSALGKSHEQIVRALEAKYRAGVADYERPD